MSVFIRLSNKSGVFVDPETGFSLRCREEKALPDKPGKRTTDWLSGGGLIKFNREKIATFSATVEDENDQTQPGEELRENAEMPDGRFEALTVSDLRKLCKELGLSYGRKQDRSELIDLIVEHEAKAAQ